VFVLSYVVSNNGLSIKTSSLIDIGANGYMFINTKFMKTVKYFLDVKPTILRDLCKV
jgi:hypothetical protein